ncbi:hypothetical protein QN360_00260 [Glaciimonas sp. CA11.2]|nr:MULTISPECIES: hypothetical protein [unclassified Glaciimonas]MDY7545953.1 hypothetical protein [Glaciimonas sp. CA11.2]MEB0012203.1 hypothetical protein [Glaciimonas sp. Cout2]MEB0082386.1 hypothetical protein [Glaciimonas sp. Gout2]MEB0161344.1 hypothetical protein [Glaciimonas sp. CA11.2]
MANEDGYVLEAEKQETSATQFGGGVTTAKAENEGRIFPGHAAR